ncbi:SDR family NAD(P)-dependent oxidoreductase [Natronosalvus halobius]|uniref:SDR family NAD(P)-dependent oxidoreductase n=1 Tax=Natronosalvus halobius TaxID=2953746 RepID=UPI00209D9A33|nr:glucose 1-dehydrogenase [Natronosalvus halobius]USZ71493.1 glucose 1-dehydrogenase [Natronosalvus halobius]
MIDQKVALVTGAGQGIGAAIAEKLSSEGYTVVVNDVDTDKAQIVAERIDNSAIETMPVVADVSSKSEVEKLVSRVIDTFGRIDVLVNNAGVQTIAPFLDLKESEWDQVLDTNLKGVFLLTQQVASTMIDNGIEGNVVNITSIHQDIPRKEKNHYDASKAGAWMLTQEIALELAEYGINVNAVAPGAIQTPMNREIMESDELREEVNAKTPWNRMGKPEEVADIVAFLASDTAEYVTGSYLRVDGGRSLV